MRTVVRPAVKEELQVQTDLHQGSGLSPFWLTVLKDRLTEEVRQDYDVFADDTVICSDCREQVEERQRGGGASWEGEEDRVTGW